MTTKRAQMTLDASFGPLVCILFFFRILLILTNVFYFILHRFYLAFESTRGAGVGGDENGPKRRIRHHLGH